MRRSVLFLALLVSSSFAIACADSTAPPQRQAVPKAKHEWTCRSGYQSGSGYVCTDSGLI